MKDVLLILTGYLLGSMPWGYWLPRIFKGVNIRKVGSGSTGAATVETLESNLKALELELSSELEPELVQLAEDPVVYWEERSELPWN